MERQKSLEDIDEQKWRLLHDLFARQHETFDAILQLDRDGHIKHRKWINWLRNTIYDAAARYKKNIEAHIAKEMQDPVEYEKKYGRRILLSIEAEAGLATFERRNEKFPQSVYAV